VAGSVADVPGEALEEIRVAFDPHDSWRTRPRHVVVVGVGFFPEVGSEVKDTGDSGEAVLIHEISDVDQHGPLPEVDYTLVTVQNAWGSKTPKAARISARIARRFLVKKSECESDTVRDTPSRRHSTA